MKRYLPGLLRVEPCEGLLEVGDLVAVSIGEEVRRVEEERARDVLRREAGRRLERGGERQGRGAVRPLGEDVEERDPSARRDRELEGDLDLVPAGRVNSLAALSRNRIRPLRLRPQRDRVAVCKRSNHSAIATRSAASDRSAVPAELGNPRDIFVFNPPREPGACNPFVLLSNLAVDATHVYWADNQGTSGGGLKRISRNANPGDAPEDRKPVGPVSMDLVSARNLLYLLVHDHQGVDYLSVIDKSSPAEGPLPMLWSVPPLRMLDLQFDGRWVWRIGGTAAADDITHGPPDLNRAHFAASRCRGLRRIAGGGGE